LLALRRDRVVHFLDLCCDSPRLSAQASSRDPPIGGAGFRMAARPQCCPVLRKNSVHA
jgi:hypothetical protein